MWTEIQVYDSKENLVQLNSLLEINDSVWVICTNLMYCVHHHYLLWCFHPVYPDFGLKEQPLALQAKEKADTSASIIRNNLKKHSSTENSTD